MTLPVVVVLALLFGAPGGGPNASRSSGVPQALAPVTVSAPPSDSAAATPCTKVLQVLPVQLDTLAPRVVHATPDTPFVVAWGDPPVILRCGVPRPAGLTPGSADFVLVVDGVSFLEGKRGTDHVFTAVDRAVYIEVTVPASYAQPPLGPLAQAIAKGLPAICLPQAAPGQPAVPQDQLCTRRG